MSSPDPVRALIEQWKEEADAYHEEGRRRADKGLDDVAAHDYFMMESMLRGRIEELVSALAAPPVPQAAGPNRTLSESMQMSPQDYLDEAAQSASPVPAETPIVSLLDEMIQRCNDEPSPYDEGNWTRGFSCAMAMALGWTQDVRQKISGSLGPLHKCYESRSPDGRIIKHGNDLEAQDHRGYLCGVPEDVSCGGLQNQAGEGALLFDAVREHQSGRQSEIGSIELRTTRQRESVQGADARSGESSVPAVRQERGGQSPEVGCSPEDAINQGGNLHARERGSAVPSLPRQSGTMERSVVAESSIRESQPGCDGPKREARGPEAERALGSGVIRRDDAVQDASSVAGSEPADFHPMPPVPAETEPPQGLHREHYRAGYSAGWSDGRNGAPMQDALKATMFFGPEIHEVCGGLGCEACHGTGEKPIPAPPVAAPPAETGEK